MSVLTPAPRVDLERPIFVIGVGRSGTSLLQSMLNAHPQLAFTPETHFFRRYLANAELRDELERAGSRAFVRRLAADADFARAAVAAEELLDMQAPLDLAAVFASLLERCARSQHKSRVGDKDPRNIDYLAALQRSFPASYVLHVIRDPRDVLLSRTKAAWSASRPWWSHPLIYREQLRRGRKSGAQLFGERYLELRYEDLIADAEAALRRICEHVELEWSPAMLDFGASAAQLIDGRELPWKRETLGPLLSKNSGKWRTGLSATQVQYTERICGEAFDELGYERSDTSLSWIGGVTPLLCVAASLAYDWKLGSER